MDAARAGAISLDDPASLIGPVGSLVAVAYIARVVWTGTETIKRLKAELTAEGYDVDEFNKVGELKAIRNAVDNGTVDGIYDNFVSSAESPLTGETHWWRVDLQAPILGSPLYMPLCSKFTRALTFQNVRCRRRRA